MKDTIKLRILVVEDDTRMLDLLCRGFREIGHAVMPASDGQAGMELATGFSFDIIVLDIGLPYHDGYVITQALRARNKMVPILMLTARDTQDDILRGFDLGADDYLVKPFSFPELVARLQALARPTQSRVTNAQLVLDPARLTVIRNNTTIQLTRTEYLLLSLLAGMVGEPVSRQYLVESLWGKQHPLHSNTLDVLVNALRGKLDAPFDTKLIFTVRKLGYGLRTDPMRSNAAYEELAG
jgi:DNA-binding response OmpR family regulator